MNSSSHWQGDIDLRFQVQADKTILKRSYAHAPLKIQRPFYPEPFCIVREGWLGAIDSTTKLS
jgi:urease accessory protein UreH